MFFLVLYWLLLLLFSSWFGRLNFTDLLPKIHKANNPGRPVINSIYCHTSRMSQFVDYYLQPEAKKLKSYVKDTIDFIKKIEAIDHVSDDFYLVSLDVPTLYTNAPH